MSVAIRPASAEDLEAIRVLLRDTWHETYDAIYGAADVERLTADWNSIEAMEQRIHRPKSLFLVAERDGGIVGVAYAAEEEPRVLSVHQLYVLPALQKSGVGSALISAVAKCFPHVGRMRLDVEVANRNAVEFYERHGFTALGMEAETVQPKMMRMERSVS